MFALTVACCCGCIGYVKPYYDQYPATVATEVDVAGLTRTTDAAQRRLADELLALIETEQLDELSFHQSYTDGGGRRVILAGTTRFVATPDQDLGEALNRITGKLQLNGVSDVAAGPLGGEQRCGSGVMTGRPASICAWADHGSLAVGVFAGRSTTDAAELLRTIRGAVVRRG
jgi:hypothetical protein